MLDVSNFPWAECTMTENRVMYQSDSVSLRRSNLDTGVMRYEFEFVTIDMDMSLGRKIKAKLSKAAGGLIYFIHPRLSYSQGTEPASNLLVDGEIAPDTNDITLTSTQPWQLMAGDYISFGNDTKVYEVAEDTLLQSGSQVVELTFNVRKQTSSGTTVKMNDVGWTLKTSGSIEVSMVASDNQDMEITQVAVEAL